MAPFPSPSVTDSTETATKIQMVHVACWAVAATTARTLRPIGLEWPLLLAGWNQSMRKGQFACLARRATSAQKVLRTGTVRHSLHVGVSPNGLMAHRVLWALLAMPVATRQHFGMVRSYTSAVWSPSGAMERSARTEHLAISAQMDLPIGTVRLSRPVGRNLNGPIAHRALSVLPARPVAIRPPFGMVRLCTSVVSSPSGAMEQSVWPEHLAISAQMDLRIGIAKPSRPVGRSLDGRMAHRALWVLLAWPVATLPHFGLAQLCTSAVWSPS
jgi:hypothetical protein